MGPGGLQKLALATTAPVWAEAVGATQGEASAATGTTRMSRRSHDESRDRFKAETV
jgi:hypothetical protein